MRSKVCIYVMLSVILLSLVITSATQLVPALAVGNGGGDYKCIDKEREALLHFKAHIEDPDGSLSTWRPGEEENCCQWRGITCDHQTGHVTKLWVSNLKGEISPSLLNLTYLNRLQLSFNSFNGSIPGFIGSMTRLTYLDLSNNSFLSGTIPHELGNLTNLRLLGLDNLVRCTVENLDWLSHLSRLEELYMSGTSLAKANHWVNVISSLSKLSLLYLDRCELSQVMHPYSSSLNSSSSSSSISTLDLRYNNLNSSMHHWLFPLTSNTLQFLDLSHNMLDGIPNWIQTPKNLTQLTYLNLSSNNFNIRVPGFNLSYSNIDLSSNNFYGPIPNFSSTLESLNLSKNRLTGGISFLCHIADGFLSFLDLSNNSLTGPIPDCLWHFKELKVLNLGNNNLFGILPNSVGSLITLEALFLNNNFFSGELPSSLRNCTNLGFLSLGARFSGNVPFWIGENLSWLYALSLKSNNFLGTIPSELCQLVNLQILDLSMNNLNGTIPSCINNLTTMVENRYSPDRNVHSYDWGNRTANGTFSVSFYVAYAMMTWQGSVREISSTLKYVRSIDLSCNNLTGQIPYELTGLYQLVQLNLSNNNLIGEIPQKIGEMNNLLTLDLSRNNLLEGIPSSMSKMTSLNYLDVSHNSLSGRIPTSTQLQSFEPSRYTGNAGLCGLPLPRQCPRDKELDVPPLIGESEDDGDGIDELERWFYIGGAAGFAIGFWIVCSSLLLNRRGRHAFFRCMDGLEDWVYLKVVVLIAKLKRVTITQ